MTEAHIIAAQFVAETELLEVVPYGEGIINHTCLVTTRSPDSPRFILQRINPQVFPRPDWLMDNLATLLAFVRSPAQRTQTTDPLRFPDLLLTQQGDYCVHDDAGASWRALSFLEQTRTLPVLSSQSEAEQVGSVLGRFHRQVQALPCEQLHDTLPGFHIAPAYLQHYQHACTAVNGLRNTPELRFCQRFIEQRSAFFAVLEQPKQQGVLRSQAVHGDPKLSNILFEVDGPRAVSLIDLDTVKPGLVHYDIGDCLRSCCNTLKYSNAAEGSAAFDRDIAEIILSRYIEAADTSLTAADSHYLVDAIRLIPLELGVRYLTDYLQGNRYFTVTDPEHNLRRAVQQFELTTSIEQQQVQLQKLIKALAVESGLQT